LQPQYSVSLTLSPMLHNLLHPKVRATLTHTSCSHLRLGSSVPLSPPEGSDSSTPHPIRLLLVSQSASLTLRCSSSEEQGTHVQLPDHTQSGEFCKHTSTTRPPKAYLLRRTRESANVSTCKLPDRLSVPTPKSKGVSHARKVATRPHTVYLLRRTRELLSQDALPDDTKCLPTPRSKGVCPCDAAT